MKTLYFIFSLSILITTVSVAQLAGNTDPSMIAGHKAQFDADRKILSWYKPEIPGAGFTHVMKLASEFIKSGTPVDPKTGMKLYYISCCFQGPHMRTQEDFNQGKTWENWPHNPACVFAGLVRSLVIDYRVFSGDQDYIDVVRNMLNYQLENGTTPSVWPWPNVPFASSDPGSKIYQGATSWENDGMRGDGLHGIEPDKIGELGLGYLLFYEVTEEKKYLEAAIHCADALASHVQNVNPEKSSFSTSFKGQSPWPFRVNARTGNVISEYCSNVIEPIHLFDELIRISDRVAISRQKIDSLQNARNIAWEWLNSKNGPMKTYIWNGYFEDVPNDPDRANRTQITPMETARYLLTNPGMDPSLDYDIPALLHWVRSAFGTNGMDAIKEQTWCYEPMASHTARYASLCALWYERTGDVAYKNEAYRHFNLASYMTDENGVVRVGPSWPGSWFSDGYGDYIRHFYEGMGAIPEWSPAGENHLLRSSSVIQTITYRREKINYRTFDENSIEKLSLSGIPKNIMMEGEKLNPIKNNNTEGWIAKRLPNGNFLVVINHNNGRNIEINF